MGVGKTTIGKKLAKKMEVSFTDSDEEIETAAGMSISDIFNEFGENYFREGEQRVMKRLLNEKPRIVASGGGAFISEEIRNLISRTSYSIWIRADLETIWGRLSEKNNRPLLLVEDPKKFLNCLIKERYPIYNEADITFDTTKSTSQIIFVKKILESLIKNKMVSIR